jgi:dTDP-4-dehydrorhamnose reductase
MRMLVTGSSGLLGANLCWLAARSHEVVAAATGPALRIPGVAWRSIDLTADDAAAQLLAEVRPQVVVHAAAEASVEACERDPARALRLNRDMAAAVAQAAGMYGARIIHLSTDSVFDGQRGGYREDDPPAPLNAYAASKLAGEIAVSEAHPGAVILRTNFYGWNALPKRSLAEWFLAALRAGTPCRGFTDVVVSTMLVTDLAEEILRVAGSQASGVFHVASRDAVNKFEFGVRLARRFGLDPELVLPASVEEAGLAARRGSRLDLDVGKYESTFDLHLPTVDAGIEAFFRQEQDHYPEHLKSFCE